MPIQGHLQLFSPRRQGWLIRINIIVPSDRTPSRFEEVFTVTDYYDGPRQGIANCGGSPHFYDCEFSVEKQDYTCLYQLTPVPAEVFSLALEDWAIWKRWEHAFASGRAGKETHPALPEDAARHAEISSLLRDSLNTDPSTSIVRAGKFRVQTPREVRPVGVLADLLVTWSEPSERPDDRIWLEESE
jgi:hypothetical protein